MEPVPVFCHACDFLFAMPMADFERSPRCEFCGSDFVEVLMDSTIPEPSPGDSPRQGGSPRGVGSPMLEDHFELGLAEHGPDYAIGTLFDEPAEMFGAADEALMFLNPMVNPPNRASEAQRNGRRGSLAPVMDQLTRMLQPSRAPTCPATLQSLRRSNVARADQDLLSECCVVCHEQYKEKERVVTLPCNHVFHEDCVMQWLNDHNTCPVCRFNLPPRTSQPPPPPNVHNRRSNQASERVYSASRRNIFGQMFGSTMFDIAPNGADQSSRGIAGRTRSHRTPPPISNQLPFFNPYNQRDRDHERDQNPRRRPYYVQDARGPTYSGWGHERDQNPRRRPSYVQDARGPSDSGWGHERDQNPRRRPSYVQDARGPTFSGWDIDTGRHHHRQRQNDGVEDRSNRRQTRDRNLSERRVLR